MAKKKKLLKPKTITSKKLKAKIEVAKKFDSVKWLEDYTDIFTFNKKTMTQLGLERFCSELVQWALNNDDALRLDQFYIPKGISKNTFDNWALRYDTAREAKKTTLHILGSRRDRGALTRKYDSGYVSKMMGHYDEDWRNEERRRNNEKAELDKTKEDNVVKFAVIEKFPSSDLVPEKKKTPEEIAGKIKEKIKNGSKEYERKD